MAGRGEYYQGVMRPGPLSGGGIGAPQSNPFMRAVQGGGGAGLPPMPAGPASAPAAAPAMATSQYSPLRDPNGPLARAGWIGALFANGPTKQEALASQLGTAQQQALQGLGQRMGQGGMTPQRAILDFANSPEGVNFFTSGGGFTDLANMAKGLTPPTEENVVMSPGQQLVGSETGNVVTSVPVGDVQKFNAMADLGGLSDDERQEAARAAIVADQTGDLSASEAALGRLVQTGRISQETADLVASGMLKVQAVTDAVGNTIGYGLVDIGTGTVQMLPQGADQPGQVPQPGSPNYAPGITPGTRPEDLEGASNGPTFEGIANPADIVDGAGTVNWLLEKLGGLGGIVSPQLAGTEVSTKRKALEIIRADANMLAKSGRVLATEMKDLRALGDTLGMMTQPIHATNTLISLHDRYDNLEQTLTEMTADPKTPKQQRADAFADLAGIRRAKANLPSRESLIAKRDQLAKQQPFEQVGEAIASEKKALEDTGIIEKDTSALAADAQTFATEAEANAAYAAGRIKEGDRIVINGKSGTVGKRRGK